jgi:hypothetical protein
MWDCVEYVAHKSQVEALVTRCISPSKVGTMHHFFEVLLREFQGTGRTFFGAG